MPSESLAPGQHLVPDLLVIVYLPIEDHGVAPISGGHGLVAFRRQIQDGQPAEAEGQTTGRLYLDAQIVWPPLEDGGGHLLHQGCQGLSVHRGGGINKADESAHVHRSSDVGRKCKDLWMPWEPD